MLHQSAAKAEQKVLHLVWYKLTSVYILFQ